MPKVSIVVPNYNYARFLGRRLESIEKQTYRDFEVILLDDGSTDNSVQVLKQFAQKHHCRLVCNEDNSANVFRQWNKGLELASGKYAWIAEADDYADERFLEIMVDRLDRNPGCGVAQCNSLRVDDNSRVMGPVQVTMYDVDRRRWQQDFVANGREECIRYLIRENTIQNASAVLFRHELFNFVGGADVSLKLTSDWKFWASLLCVSDFVFVAEPLNYFRTHGLSVRARTRTWASVTEGLQVIKYIVNTLDVPKDALQDLHARLALVFLHAWITRRPTPADLRLTRELMQGLEFGFSRRAACGFIRQILQATTRHWRRLHEN